MQSKYDYDYDESFSVTDSEQMKNQLRKIKQMDRGYNKLVRNINKNGKAKRSIIEAYTSSGFGNHIRDAETGQYYQYLVGTKDEDLFFSVILATGECKSTNSSSTFFYLSPERYMIHLNQTVDQKIINNWREKRDIRMNENKVVKKQSVSSYVTVK